MDWSQSWQPGNYIKDDVVTYQGYQMVANKDTDEYPIPAPIGDPFFVREIPGTPPAFSEDTANASYLLTGARYSLLSEGYVTKVLYYLPASAVGFRAEVWIDTGRAIQLVPQFIVTGDDVDVRFCQSGDAVPVHRDGFYPTVCDGRVHEGRR